MMEEAVVKSAMMIILHAGDARTYCKEALDAIAVMDFKRAEDKLKEAQKKITEAHIVQTNEIQAETRGERREYNILFAHAQDTLMTIHSEINLAKQMLKIFCQFDNRMKKLERGDHSEKN